MSHDTHSEEYHPHVAPISTYIKLLIVLMVLMGLTIVSYKVDLTSYFGEVAGTFANNIVAMMIACTKATLVIMIFMGVKWASNLVKLYVFLGFAGLGFFAITFSDYGTRHMETEPGWEGQKQLKITGVNAPLVDHEAVKRATVGEASGH
jgi:caa(3)-type oxidase subunit IV